MYNNDQNNFMGAPYGGKLEFSNNNSLMPDISMAAISTFPPLYSSSIRYAPQQMIKKFSIINKNSGTHLSDLVWDYKPEFKAGDDIISVPVFVGHTSAMSSGPDGLAIYRQEVQRLPDNTIKELTPLVPVVGGIETSSSIRDFNISNNRYYRYLIYPKNRYTQSLTKAEVFIATHWSGWSLSQLYPVPNKPNCFFSNKKSVWVFNYNIDTGAQQQEVSRTIQTTLGRYPRYTQGAHNYISGTVSCLLGSQVLPADYIISKGFVGGYIEKLPFETQLTSNEKVDMLNEWRNFVANPYPKLLKDRKGQKFIVTVTDCSTEVNDNIGYQPETVSFTWTQIEDAEDKSIIEDIG